MSDFDDYCKKNKIDGNEKEKKLNLLKKLINKYYYEPGEAIGIIAAQSISEPATQMTMRSYTLASQSDRLSKVTQGLPRLIEIFDARKTFEKNMIIYLREQYNTKEKAKDIASRIKSMRVSDAIKYHSIDLVEMRIELELESESYKEKIKKIVDKYLKGSEMTSRGAKVYIKPKKDDLKNLRKIRNKLLKFHIAGVKGIEDVVIVKEEENWIIQTTGTNLKKILLMDEIDVRRTKTNDMHQVYEILGIEAARSVVFNES